MRWPVKNISFPRRGRTTGIAVVVVYLQESWFEVSVSNTGLGFRCGVSRLIYETVYSTGFVQKKVLRLCETNMGFVDGKMSLLMGREFKLKEIGESVGVMYQNI